MFDTKKSTYNELFINKTKSAIAILADFVYNERQRIERA